jgi:protein-disulfide isomerase
VEKEKLFSILHPYDACDETLDRCLAKRPANPVIVRMANSICRHIKMGKPRQEIERAFTARGQSIVSMAKPVTFVLEQNTLAGNPQSPIQVVVYACARCPFCKLLIQALYKDVTEGVLKNKVRLYFQPFPIRSHPGATEGALAMVSASRLGKFWPFVSRLYEHFDTFCPKLLPEWAAEVGLDRAAFERALADPKIRADLVALKQEGIRNKVEATPTLFINGTKYVYELQRDAVVDVLLEIFESR